MFKKITILLILATSFLYIWEVNANSLYCFKNASGVDICTDAEDKSKALSQFDYIKSWNESMYFVWYNEEFVNTANTNANKSFSYEKDNNNFNLYIEAWADNNSNTWNNWWFKTNWFNTNWLNEKTTWPELNCIGLPWCKNTTATNTATEISSGNIWISVISSIIWQAIQFVAVIAVIALILSGIMYLLSWWEEEKIKKAKSWIIWSLVWVFLSISAWSIINILNKITIW